MKRIAWGLTIGWLCFAGAARASHDPFARGFDLVPVKPTAALLSGIALEGAELPAAKSFRFALLLDPNLGVLALRRGDEKLGDLIPFRQDLHLLAAYQLHRRVELAADLPLTAYQAHNFGLLAEQGLPENPPASFGLGSVRLLPRFALLDHRFPIPLAAVVELRLPAPSSRDFTGDSGLVFAPRLAVQKHLGELTLIGNLGYRLRSYHTQFLNLFLGNEFTLGAGAIWGLPDWQGKLTQVKAVVETQLATATEAPFTFSDSDSLKTPWELLLGIRGKVRGNWGVELNLGRGLAIQTGYGRETFRAMFALRYDYEHHDRDGDGLADEVDGCPDVPEDLDGFQDSDGCPEEDNDRDGVPDREDGCPMDPGPKEYDGCPDRDQDQIPDNVDKCPDQPGPAEDHGCPSAEPPVVLESDRIRVRGEILFESGEATIQPASYKMLDEVYKVLAENPEVGPVLIEGHTDNRGPKAYNQDLSERRAKSVAGYLVKKGIAKQRLKSKGYGFDRPVADNDTPLGRAKNRRTEFKLVGEEKEAEKK